jgi:hypothetical protein
VLRNYQLNKYDTFSTLTYFKGYRCIKISKGGVHVNSILIYEIIAGIVIAVIILAQFYTIKNKLSDIKIKKLLKNPINYVKSLKKRLNPKEKKLY